MKNGCPFCDYEGPSPVISAERLFGQTVFIIAPLKPVTPGHRLVIPEVHVADFTEDPELTAAVMYVAAKYAAGWQRLGPLDGEINSPADFLPPQMNLITSKGPDATQTIEHLHVHLVPRRVGDGLALPWAP